MGLFDKLTKFMRINNEILVYEIGEKFPMEGYNSLGDHISVALNSSSFDVVISLTGLSEQEKKAIKDDEFEVYIAATKLVPFIILKFGDVFKTDMTINIKKMNPNILNIWFESNVDTVNIFLLEGNDATLQCIRPFKFEHMDILKSICKKQLKNTMEEIDSHINAVYQEYSIDEIMQAAKVKFNVLGADTIL